MLIMFVRVLVLYIYTHKQYTVHIHTLEYIHKLGIGRVCNSSEGSLICSIRLHLLDPKYSKTSIYYNIFLSTQSGVDFLQIVISYWFQITWEQFILVPDIIHALHILGNLVFHI